VNRIVDHIINSRCLNCLSRLEDVSYVCCHMQNLFLGKAELTPERLQSSAAHIFCSAFVKMTVPGQVLCPIRS
jgi:hypothetical protein